mmetsp:Transcript_6121/g.16649  ORF Transcript_6121/g.16649 Transcript_6121/m.16649 type:complete len:210 (+) Transcript_6121:271-900(+)
MALKPDEGTFAPILAPAVADEPVLAKLWVHAIAHEQHCMVHNGIPGTAIEHARVVGQPIRGIDGDNNRAVRCYRIEQWLEFVLWQAHKALNCGALLCHTAPPGSLVSTVVGQAVVADIREGQLRRGAHAAAVAAAMLGIRHTIHELLEGEPAGRASRQLRMRLQGAHCRNSPAGTAITLVAHESVGNVELRAPVCRLGHARDLRLHLEK